VILYGTLRDLEHKHGEGIVWDMQEEFYIVVGCDLDVQSFILEWCALPEFVIDVTTGQLKVH
jgi:hypothetical protein